MTLGKVREPSANNNAISVDTGSMIKGHANQSSLCGVSPLTDLLLVVKLIIILYVRTQIFPFITHSHLWLLFICPYVP